eukprot:14319225-Heterocapsa_arctica.AAC.1
MGELLLFMPMLLGVLMYFTPKSGGRAAALRAHPRPHLPDGRAHALRAHRRSSAYSAGADKGSVSLPSTG